MLAQLKDSHIKKLENIKSTYHSKRHRLCEELSQVEKLIEEKSIRLSQLFFYQFIQKRSLTTELDELKERKQDIILLIKRIESEYSEYCDQENTEFNLLLLKNGLEEIDCQ